MWHRHTSDRCMSHRYMNSSIEIGRMTSDVPDLEKPSADYCFVSRLVQSDNSRRTCKHAGLRTEITRTLNSHHSTSKPIRVKFPSNTGVKIAAKYSSCCASCICIVRLLSSSRLIRSSSAIGDIVSSTAEAVCTVPLPLVNVFPGRCFEIAASSSSRNLSISQSRGLLGLSAPALTLFT